MPGPCRVCRITSRMVKTKKGVYTFACEAHHEQVVTGKKP